MSNRLDSQVERKVDRTRVDARNNLNEIKNKQIVGGDSILSTHTVTGNTWDVVSFTVPQYTYQSWIVKFTPDVQTNVFVIPEVTAQITGDAYGGATARYYPDPNNVTGDTYRSVVVTVTAPDTTITVSLRFGFIAIGPGTITWALGPSGAQ